MRMNNNKAFTLIEVVLTVAILGILMTVVFSLFSMASKPHVIVSREYILQSNARLASQKVSSMIKRSSATFAYKDVASIFREDIFPDTGGSGGLLIINEDFIDELSMTNSAKAIELTEGMEKYDNS